MLFSGHKQRSISDQTGNLEFNWTMSLSNQTGGCNVGLSGAKTFQFQFKSGKIYDTSGNFVQSYENNVAFNISGQLSANSYDYSIDGELIALGNPINTGKLSWLFIDPTNVNINFDGYIKGSVPDYSLTSGAAYLYENYTVTGRIVNNNPNIAFRIFNASLGQVSGVGPYTLSSFTTGDIYNTGYILFTSDQIGLSDYLVPVTLDTNFGQVTYNFLISGDYGVVPDVYLNISPDTTNIVNGIAKNYLAQFSNYPSGAPLGITLEYLSGITGNIYFYTGVTKSITGDLTGTIVGQGYLSQTVTGIVSGIDPKTSVNETGVGTGVLNSQLITATGAVSGTYEIPVYGKGQGNLEVDYQASGQGFGGYTGTIPLSGGYLNLVGYNFVGTGDNPGVATGLVPVGTGVIFVNPTGCFSLSSGLAYGTGYYSGILSVSKVYEGEIVVPYNILAVGWATGDYIAGTVDSNFNRSFEQGQYVFTKFYSGTATQIFASTGAFDPSDCISPQVTTGLIIGTFGLSAILNCDSVSTFPTISVSGIPTLIYDENGSGVSGASVVLVEPSGGFGINETTASWLSGNQIRTLTSRPGITPSGTGLFQNVIGNCLAPGSQASTGVEHQRIWKETIQTSGGSGTFDSLDNTFYKVSTQFNLTGTGTFNSGVSGIVTQDYAAMSFWISGEGLKTIGLRGLNPSANRALEFYLLKSGVQTNVWGANGIQDFLSGSSDAFDRWRVPMMDGVDVDDDTVVVLDNLTSGFYRLFVVEAPVDPDPVIYFKSSIFTGCESNGNILIQIAASGNIHQRIWFELKDYEDLTARSGVNYSPIHLRYTDPASQITGQPYTYFGGFFNPNTDTEEVLYEFTIPVYDNANYGGPHQFRMTLSNLSGATSDSRSTALVSIFDNDVTGLSVVTGFSYGTGLSGFITGITGLYAPDPMCIPTGELPPPATPTYYPYLTQPNPAPEGCPDYEPTCCECGNLSQITGLCNGVPTIGYVLNAGDRCGQMNIDTNFACNNDLICSPQTSFSSAVIANYLQYGDDSWMYAGPICSAKSSVFKYISTIKGPMDDDFVSSSKSLEVRVVSDGCLVKTLSPSTGCFSTGELVLGSEATCDYLGTCYGTLYPSSGLENCVDYSKKQRVGRKKTLPIGPSCQTEHVFLRVRNTYYDYAGDAGDYTYGFGFTGWTEGRGGPAQIDCPPPPRNSYPIFPGSGEYRNNGTIQLF